MKYHIEVCYTFVYWTHDIPGNNCYKDNSISYVMNLFNNLFAI